MIRVRRGAEPEALIRVRNEQLAKLRKIAKERELSQNDITGYKEPTAEVLWRAQHYKCCDCEFKIQRAYNDVEHYRPKARADRQPGSGAAHGYWWLAFTWENLLFACPVCNRSGKNDQFPLDHGSRALSAEKSPPERERPLLLDPSQANPVEHVEFCPEGDPLQWRAKPRAGSELGQWTIKVCHMNCPDLLELRKDHVERFVLPEVKALKRALNKGKIGPVRQAYERCRAFFAPEMSFSAVSFDAIRHSVSCYELLAMGLRGPEPSEL